MHHKKTLSIRFRATAEERALLDHVIKQRNDALPDTKPINRNQVLQALTRNFVDLGPTFLFDELAAVKESNRHLMAIGRNLNQVVKRIHAGELASNPLSDRYLDRLLECIEDNRAALNGLIEHNQKRGQQPLPDEFR